MNEATMYYKVRRPHGAHVCVTRFKVWKEYNSCAKAERVVQYLALNEISNFHFSMRKRGNYFTYFARPPLAQNTKHIVVKP